MILAGYDTFDDVADTSLDAHTMNQGSGWTEEVGDWKINGANRAVTTGVQGDALRKWLTLTESGGSNLEVQAIVNLPIGGTGGVVFRGSDADSFWLFDISDPMNWMRLWRYESGVWDLVKYAWIAISPNTDYLLRVRAIENMIQCWVDGAALGMHYSYWNATETKVGFRGDLADMAVDAIDICVDSSSSSPSPESSSPTSPESSSSSPSAGSSSSVIVPSSSLFVSSGGGSTVVCDEICGAMPEQFELTVAGISNNECPYCTNYNGTFTLTWQDWWMDYYAPRPPQTLPGGATCIWGAKVENGCDDWGAGGWCMFHYVNRFRVYAVINDSGGYGPHPWYWLMDGAFSCTGSNTFPRITTPSPRQCGFTWPGSVTVSPI
jgi:hypothetical protein